MSSPYENLPAMLNLKCMKLLDSIKEAVKRWSISGMHWPFVHDPTAEAPSVTLMFFYLTFLSALIFVCWSSTAMILKGDHLKACVMPVTLWFAGFIFYRLRKLDTVEIDLDDHEIKLSSGGDDEKDPPKDPPPVP